MRKRQGATKSLDNFKHNDMNKSPILRLTNAGLAIKAIDDANAADNQAESNRILDLQDSGPGNSRQKENPEKDIKRQKETDKGREDNGLSFSDKNENNTKRQQHIPIKVEVAAIDDVKENMSHADVRCRIE